MIGPVLGGRPRLKFNGALNLVFDGNSLTAGNGASSGSYVAKMGLMAPCSNGGRTGGVGNYVTDKEVVLKARGINGQTTAQMTSSATDIDSLFVAGKVNILVAWEGTNSMNSGRTAAQAVQDLVDYIAVRKAVSAWNHIVIGTCLPRQKATQAETDALNAKIDAYNALLLANYRSMGATRVFDVRQPGSPFIMPNYLQQTFEDMAASTGLWASGETGGHTHLNDAGYLIIAQYVGATLVRLPAR